MIVPAELAVSVAVELTDIIEELDKHPETNPLTPQELFVLGFAAATLGRLAEARGALGDGGRPG